MPLTVFHMRTFRRKISAYDYFVYFFYAFCVTSLLILYYLTLFRNSPNKDSFAIKIALIMLVTGSLLFVFREFKRNFFYRRISTKKSANESFDLSKSILTENNIQFAVEKTSEIKLSAIVRYYGFSTRDVELSLIFCDQAIFINVHKRNYSLIPFREPEFIDQLIISAKE
jgi:hypothetical protein